MTDDDYIPFECMRINRTAARTRKLPKAEADALRKQLAELKRRRLERAGLQIVGKSQ